MPTLCSTYSLSPARSLRANRPRRRLWDGGQRQSGKAPFFVKRRFSSVIPARRNVRGARKHEAGRSLRAARCCRRTLRRGGLPRAARMPCAAGRPGAGTDLPGRAPARGFGKGLSRRDINRPWGDTPSPPSAGKQKPGGRLAPRKLPVIKKACKCPAKSTSKGRRLQRDRAV